MVTVYGFDRKNREQRTYVARNYNIPGGSLTDPPWSIGRRSAETWSTTLPLNPIRPFVLPKFGFPVGAGLHATSCHPKENR